MNLTRVAAMTAFLFSTGAGAASLGGPLNLADEGSFFVNGENVNTQYPGASLATGPGAPGRITVNQMYVHYRIPAASKALPVIMVHGSNHSGVTYETTPDGREGWATYFVRRGHPVYVVDHAGRGRSGFNPTRINEVRDKPGTNPSTLPTMFFGTHERAWVNFRFGPEYGKPFPNLQFPLEALDQYLQQLIVNSETALERGAAHTVDALAVLLDKIGPAVVMVHSQSGVYGVDVVRKRPQAVRALVSVEGGCENLGADDAKSAFAKVPFVSVWGDNSVGAKGTVNGDARRNRCLEAVDAIKAAGGRAAQIMLPSIGIAGNSHMMMMDKNNLQVADVVLKWIADNAAR